MIYLLLIFEFFKIGIFSFGGGYATVPFLYRLSETFHWYSLEELSHMIAIASITPGPVGINVATYAGYKTAGILGAVLATISEILPALIIVILVSKILKKFNDNFYINSLIEALKPISCALLTAVAFGLCKQYFSDIKAIILLSLLLIISWKSKKSPLFYILLAGTVGFVFTLLNY